MLTSESTVINFYSLPFLPTRQPPILTPFSYPPFVSATCGTGLTHCKASAWASVSLWECRSLWWNISISVICQRRRCFHSRILTDCAILSGSPSTIITVENNTLTCSTSGYPLPTVLLYTCPGIQDTYVPTSAFWTDVISCRLHMMLMMRWCHIDLLEQKIECCLIWRWSVRVGT